MPRNALLQRFRTFARRSWLREIPSQCAVCSSWPAQRLCDACIAQFARPQSRCISCALPVPASVRQCGRCVLHSPLLERCVAAVAYEYPWAGVLAQFKFRSDPGWAMALAQLMRSAPWAEPLMDAADWIVPVPLAPERLRERGFNQAWELARQLHPTKARRDWLLRVRSGVDQHALGRSARLRNLQGAFATDPLKTEALIGTHVLLIDDVMTTGATLHAAAAALHGAGVARVSALILARVSEPDA